MKDEVTIISSQRYRNDERVEAKRANKDYNVQVSPVFAIDGEPVRVMTDGHHSYAAAKLDGVEPNYEEQTPQENDRISWLMDGDVDTFLEASWLGDDWYDVDTGCTYF